MRFFHIINWRSVMLRKFAYNKIFRTSGMVILFLLLLLFPASNKYSLEGDSSIKTGSNIKKYEVFLIDKYGFISRSKVDIESDKPEEYASEVKTSKENYTNQAKDGLHIVVKTIVAVALLVGILTILPQKAEKQPYAVSAIAPVVSVELPPNISSSSHMTPEQCYEEGKRYYRGSEGRVRDYEAAVRWFKAAADKGMAEAQNALGACYFEGQGVEIDYDEAVRLFKAAAEKDTHHAQNNLASRYYKGEGVLLDYEKAVYWYEKAAMNGNIYAQYNLGICYYEGNGVSKNTQEAIKWIEKSARMGNQDAMSWLESKKGSLKSENVVSPVF